MLILKDTDTVYIAYIASSTLCSGCADFKWVRHEDNLHLWEIPNADKIIVAVNADGFVNDLFKYDENFISGELTLDRLVVEIIPKIKKRLGAYNCLNKDGNMNASFVFAQKDRAFVLYDDFYCTEIENFYALDTGAHYAFTAFRISKNLEPEQRLLFVDNIINKAMNHPPYPLVVMDTKTCKPYLLENK